MDAADILADLRAKAEAATPGPWGVRVGHSVTAVWSKLIDADLVRTCGTPYWERTSERDQCNATFIAATNPETILKLIAVCEAADELRNGPGNPMDDVVLLDQALAALNREQTNE